MPYRIDIPGLPPDALDLLVQMGALDVEVVNDGLAAIIPDSVRPDTVAAALSRTGLTISPATARDDGSVWLLSPRVIRVGRIVIAPADVAAPEGALRLTDSTAFGTGYHPTTTLCVEAIDEAFTIAVPAHVLDVGTGSGVLALAALRLGASHAVGLDICAEALQIAAGHARLNNLADRLDLVLGGPDVLPGAWPLVVANVLAAPLVEMAPALVRRVASRGRLILSGIPSSVESEVREAYLRFGMRQVRTGMRAGWSVVVLQPSW